MKKRATFSLLVAAVSFTCLTGFGLGDLKTPIGDKLGGGDKCDKGDEKCQLKAEAKGAAIVAGTALAVKLLKDMVVEYKVQQITGESEVIKKYLKENKTLPDQPTPILYTSKPLKKTTVKPGSKITYVSEMEIVPSKKKEEVLIKERLVITNADDHKKKLEYPKLVNAQNKRGGRYKNTLSFTMPKKMPQGVYPISVELFINDKKVKNIDSDVKLVLNVDRFGAGELVALNNVQ